MGDAWPPSRVENMVEHLHRESTLAAVGFPDGTQASVELCQAAADVRRYLVDPGVFERGRELECVDPQREGKALHELQCTLRRKVVEQGLCVEVNPSSNLLIGNLGDILDHPLWRLNPPKPDENAPDPVGVCIGSDDPLTFATTLPQEYQMVCDALVAAGCSELKAHAWIDKARQQGLDARFTLDPPSELKDLIHYYNTEAERFAPIL